VQMSPRVLIVAAALVFWGLQTEFLWLSLVLSAIIAASGIFRRHLSLTPREFARLWDVTLVALVGAAVYQRQTSSVSGAVLSFLQWLPILLFPMMGAFVFCDFSKLPYSTFVFWWRDREQGDERKVDVTYAYFGICLLAASASANRAAWFYPGATALMTAALWLNRPRRLRGWATLALLAAVSGAGFFLQAEWRDFHAEFESKTVKWFAGFFPRPFEDQETYTSLGDVAKLKSSGRVLMRVEAAPGSTPPRLLRQVSFDQYRRGTWLSTRRTYSPVTEASPGVWDLSAAGRATNSARLSIVVPEARILLPLPAGAARARDLTAGRLERNRFGNVRVWDCADPLRCSVDFEGVNSYESGPSEKDVQVPRADEAAVQQVVQELALSSLPPRDVLPRVGSFFAENFRYDARMGGADVTPTNASLIAPFLQGTRRGHCEYFATSAALILREVGIPARYAMGYAAVEEMDDGRSYRIRERHAHSWVLAYIEGRWMDFDPTPALWPSAEAREASMLARVSDWWANVKFRFATTRLLPEFSARTLGWGAGCAAAFVIWRVWRKRTKRRRKARVSSIAQAYSWPGLDSEFFEVERWLQGGGLARKSSETTAAWFGRVGRQCPASDALQGLVTLHYKYRFDPMGLTREEREHLAQEARLWLSRERKIGTTSARAG